MSQLVCFGDRAPVCDFSADASVEREKGRVYFECSFVKGFWEISPGQPKLLRCQASNFWPPRCR